MKFKKNTSILQLCYYRLFASLFFIFSLPLQSAPPPLSSLDPLSITEHLAYYELYPDSPSGKQALTHAWDLLQTSGQKLSLSSLPSLPLPDIHAIISLITKEPFDTPPKLSLEQLSAIETLATPLKNRSLKGHTIWKKEEIDSLPPQEIDLSRALLILQFEDKKEEILTYESALDLMALQILVRLPPSPLPSQIIQAMNRFVFEEMKFHFPPHSIYAKEIDLYTFLPSVLDSREGVCLGVSVLYLCLSQRLGLPLEIITPPGHIYLRHREGVKVINIETTARGIDIPSESYLGIDTRRLQQRNLKEVIGLSLANQASVFWGNSDHEAAVKLYEKAQQYLKGDPLYDLFLGLNYLFVGKKQEGIKRLKPLQNFTFDYAVSAETLIDDYFQNKTNIEGLKAVFLHVDETRASILEKQKKLLTVLEKYPRFRAGLLQLAVTWLQLSRGLEAKEVLEKYHEIDPTNAVVEYYLSILSLQRFDYNQAWGHLQNTERLLERRGHKSKALKGVRTELKRLSPS